MKRISYSQLSTFVDCPMRWKLRYVDKISKSESNIYLIFGTAMHETIQFYLNIMYNVSIKKADELDLHKMLYKNLVKEFESAKEQDKKDPCTLDQLKEFFSDGIEILNWISKYRSDYFKQRGYKLIGCEIPVDVKLRNNLQWIGYLDLVILDEKNDIIKIYDIKTSTMGWNKWQKRDKNKTQQLLLYKQFYSQQYNHPVDKIEVEYFIVKRKLFEKSDFPQKRVQKFVPASGKRSMKKVANRLNDFIDIAFTTEGEYNVSNINVNPSKKTCKFCEFNQTEYCEAGVK